MSAGTCRQRWLTRRGPRLGCWITGRRPHVLPDGAPGGYARCRECGVEIYVGEPPMPRDLAEYIAGPDAAAVAGALGIRLAGGAR